MINLLLTAALLKLYLNHMIKITNIIIKKNKTFSSLHNIAGKTLKPKSVFQLCPSQFNIPLFFIFTVGAFILYLFKLKWEFLKNFWAHSNIVH